MNLTAKNYHQANKDYLTSSKLNAYLVDPYYYYQKHVLKTLEDEKTDALILGSAVDCYVTKGKKAFNKLFKPVARRTNAEDLKYTEMTQAAFQEAVAISERVIGTTAFRELEGFERQVVLTDEKPLWMFKDADKGRGSPIGKSIKPLCGMLDFLKVEGHRATIVDLKTARTCDERKYFYHALEYGYFIQAAVYTKLVFANFPEVQEIDFFHLVVSKENKNCYQVQTFQFAEAIVSDYIKRVNSLIFEISSRTDWKPKDASFKDKFILGATVVPTEWENTVQV